MVEKARRAKVEESRPDADPAWEILARDDADDPPRYVGTVRAADAETAHEEATRLFCWYAHEVWVCPTGEIRKFSADAAADAAEESDLAVPESGTEGRTHEL
ncbi:Htur_1727 family rSAM-partnered candidate RiPP [Halorussus sp. MSC15.2]|uniref:Htur_1727 family rSAM-partnered candidate RiPP n=1 Tax=Halorussus sp. MSC15.2 TaxID=2283638 RepID=UPI0013D70EAD|nr:Htur_1727 family rSAM-partnered candidate RiPP [Halorussus sp. MSC15.2]NEU57087.1 rSAM-partnered protein [Halorussus sp. MSC15.2]